MPPHMPPDPFVDNIDPRFEFAENRPRASSVSRTAEPRRRSIWGQPSHPPPPPSPPRTIVSTSPTPLPTLPSVIDHSTQTTGVGPNGQPFNITRRPGEDQAEMLSRFLYVAGAALAASLVGSTDTTTAQLQDFSADFADARDDSPDTVPTEGSFEGFLRALRQGRSQFAHALRNDSDSSSSGESGSAFTYLLMYRFNSRTTPPSAAGTPAPETIPEEPDNTSMAVESRPPTPLPSSSSSTRSTRSDTSSPPEPRMIPFVIIGVQPVPPRETGHTGVPSFSEGVASLLANARQNPTASRPALRPTTSSAGSVNSGITPLQTSASIPTIPGAWRDSPPPMSAAATEARRRRASVDGSYRHSEGLQARERESNTRAWQMYIYGGAYPENHLIFTAPTLFTESPTSEDMLLLASILGEVKPPVASKEEIDAAGGISIVGQNITLEHERCLVCLSDYECGEEIRTLSGCGHLFHKQCIDQWLASGRNACPLCRGVGVATIETKSDPPSTPEEVLIN